MYDIAIIGLGPAGATLARLLDKQFKIAAIDKKQPFKKDKGFQKPCGGLLAPDAQKALAKFNFTLPKNIIVDPQIFSVRTIDLDTGNTRYYQRFYININRRLFDNWIIEQIPNEVDIFYNTVCINLHRIKNGFLIKFIQNGQEKTIEAKQIVGADGANSIVRKTFFPNKQIRSYVSIQQWFVQSHMTPFYSCIFDSENTDCYSWSISKNGYLIFGGAYPPKNCRKRFESQKHKLQKQQNFHFGNPIKTEGCLVLRPSSPFDFCCGKEKIFLVGEAAGFISPSSLEGISSGINTGYYLSEILNKNKKNSQFHYKKATLKLRLKLSAKLLKCPFLFYPPLRNLVMKSGLSSINVIKK